MAEFEALVGAQTEVFTDAEALLSLTAFGGDIDITTGAGWAAITFDVDAESAVGGRGAFTLEAFGGDLTAGGWGVLEYTATGIANGLLPTVAYGTGYLRYEVDALSQYTRYNEADVGFELTAFGGDFGGDGGGWGDLEFAARGSETIVEQNPGLLFLTPGFMYGAVGYDTIFGFDDLTFANVASDAVTWAASDVLRVAGVAGTLMTATSSASDTLRLNDRTSLVGYLAMESAVTFASEADVTLYSLLAAASALQLTDTAMDTLHSYGVVASMFVMADAAAFPRQISDQGDDTIELDDAAVGNIRALTIALDTLTLADDANGTLYAFGAASDAFNLTDLVDGLMSGNLAAYDTINFVGQLRILGEDYTAYSVSLDNQAVSEYENYNFDSFGVHAGTAYGLGDGGIYRLEGATDAGEAIVGRVRGPLNNLGTALKKAVPAVYIGYTSTNTLGLKVITTDGSTGTKKINLYSLSPIAKQSTTDGRFTPSKGLHSVYWQFELISEEGGQFELDEVRMWRMVLNRRK